MIIMLMKNIVNFWKKISQGIFKGNVDDISTIKVNKIVLHSNNDKGIQTLNCRETFAYETCKK